MITMTYSIKFVDGTSLDDCSPTEVLHFITSFAGVAEISKGNKVFFKDGKWLVNVKEFTRELEKEGLEILFG